MTAADHTNTDPACPNCGMTARVSPSRKQPGRWWCDGCAAHFDKSQFIKSDCKFLLAERDRLADALRKIERSGTVTIGKRVHLDHAAKLARDALAQTEHTP